MTQTEHLKLIRARCVELLEIAECRAGVRWHAKTREDVEFVISSLEGPVAHCGGLTHAKPNAAFIASCAGAAEAGWLATIAAVDAFFKLDGVTYGWDGDCGATCIADTLTDSIISAWPIELLNNK